LKTLRDSHLAKVLQAEFEGKDIEYASTIDDRSRQQTRRSRIHCCRITSRDLEYVAPIVLSATVNELRNYRSLFSSPNIFLLSKPKQENVGKENKSG
jgi:hypothetical protein